MNSIFIDSDKTKSRLETLSDGIFAITMTMMILDLKIPENSFHNLSPAELNSSLLSLLPSIKSYILSFFILAIFWIRQQIQLNFLRNIKMYSIITYIVFLLLIGFVPFTVNLIKRYPDYHLPFFIYILNLLMISVILFVNAYMASKVDDKTIPEEARINKSFILISGVTILIFLAALIISFFNTELAFYVLILDPVFFFFYKKFSRIKL